MNADQEDSSMLLVSVAAESLQSGKAGVLIIQKHHDTSFSVVFCSIGEIEMADIDCVSVDVKERRVSFNDFTFSIPSGENSSLPSQQTTSLSFSIPDRVHLQHFVDAQAECQRVCNMFLELRSRFMDIYCGAVYSELGVQMQSSSCLNGPITEELSKLQLQSLRKLDTDIVHGSLIEENVSSTNQQIINSPANSSHHVNSSIKVCCFYCEATPKDGELFNHPYVPLSFDKSRVLMCNVCLNNWKDYRDAAHRDLQLILPGEINEEICALCSDTPDTLVLCNVCPRSFCNTCLRHVLGDSATDRILHSHNDTLWKCMSCANRVSAQPLLSRDVWVSWKKIQSENNHPNPTANPKNSNNSHNNNSRSKDTEVDVSSTVKLSIPSGQKMKRSATAVNSKMKKAKPSPSKAVSIPANKTLSVDMSPVPQTESTTDEVFYFAQYLDFLERKCTYVVEKFKKRQMRVINNASNENGGKNSNNSVAVNSNMRGKRKQHEISRNHNESENDEEEDETDDACFLCKDGGEVIECDFSRRVHCLSVRRGAQGSGNAADVVQRAPQQCRCRKVYHSYCLNYEVSDEVQKWCCPRHFCSHCGRTDTLHYLCAFCPLSLCKTCAPLYARGCVNQGSSAEGAAKTQRTFHEDNLRNKKFYFTLPNLTPKSQDIDLSDEEEVHKGVASQWMAPYRFPNVTLIACDTCATHCLKLQRESSGGASKYFYTLLGDKCFFDVSRDTQVEEANATLQDTDITVAEDSKLVGKFNSSNPSISHQVDSCSDTANDDLINDSNSNSNVAVDACDNVSSLHNDSAEIKKIAGALVSPPPPPLQVMCVSDDEGI